MKHCTLGGIIKREGGYGFSVVFADPKLAQKYKDIMKWIIQDDGIGVKVKRGYYDAKKN